MASLVFIPASVSGGQVTLPQDQLKKSPILNEAWVSAIQTDLLRSPLTAEQLGLVWNLEVCPRPLSTVPTTHPPKPLPWIAIISMTRNLSQSEALGHTRAFCAFKKSSSG